MRMKTFALGTLGMAAALTLGAAGCELIAAVDHDLIPQGGGSIGGGGGAGGGTTTTTTGGGGMGGSGGGDCVPENCPDPGSDCLQKACDGAMCGTPTPLGSGTACNSAPGEGGGGGTMAGVCDGAGECVECVDNTQCTAPEVCDTTAHQCVPEQCQNGMQDGMETGEDCGGPDCGDCPNGQGCMGEGDCISGYCNAMVCTACTGTGAGQCATTDYCDNGVCVPKEANGTACTDPAQCSTGNCANTSQGGICCSDACGSPCESCAMADTGSANGTCATVPDNSDPKMACPSAGPSCMGSSLNPLDTCVAGACSGTAAPCPNNLVCQSATTCFATCTAHANCVSTHFCGGVGGAGGTANQCNMKLGTGQMCSVDEECANGTCTVGAGGGGGAGPMGTCN